MKKLKKSNFLEGAFIATFCLIITKILGIIYVIPFYKIIGEQGGTLYGYAYNIYNIFLTISATGIPLAISKLTSEYNTLKEDEKKVRMYKIVTTTIVIFSIISFLICFIFAPNFSHLILGNLEGGNSESDVTFVIRLISFALLIIPCLSITRGYLQGHRFISEPSISQVIEQAVRIAIIIIGSYLCVYIFKLEIKYAVGIAVFAACLSGIATYIYLHTVIKKNKNQIGLDIKTKPNKKEDIKIFKKIILYSLPFILINLVNTLYSSTDMILILRTLPNLGFSAPDTEFISSVFTTWGIKFNTIIMSIATGLVVSLIPNMVKDYTEKNLTAVNTNFNKCLKIVLLILLPLAIFISGMSQSMWNVFYSPNNYGQMIIKYSIIVTVLDCLYTIISSILQSLNKTKIIYISILSGTLTNIILDVPLMNLFYKLSLPAYYGAITATLIGMLLANIIGITILNKEMKFDYKETLQVIPKLVLSLVVLILMLYGFNQILPVNSSNKMIQLFNLFISVIPCMIIFIFINRKQIKDVIPQKILKKIGIK